MSGKQICHALVAGAGGGSRFASQALDDEPPKQYSMLCGKPLIWHSLAGLLSAPWIDDVCVVLASDDNDWEARRSAWHWPGRSENKLQVRYCGGASRAGSVINGIDAMCWAENDWVLVHDAARPCLSGAALQNMYDVLRDDAVGGLLAVPLADTLKRASSQPSLLDQRVASTLPRDGLWLAQTPQMFRVGMLRSALQQNARVTDEASAIEAMGHAPRLVFNNEANPKITWRDDLALAESILQIRCSADS